MRMSTGGQMLCGNSEALPSAFGWNASCSDADARPRLFACQHLPRSQFASHDGFRWIRNHPSSSSSRITDTPTDWEWIAKFWHRTIFAFPFPSLLIELISSQKVVSLFSWVHSIGLSLQPSVFFLPIHILIVNYDIVNNCLLWIYSIFCYMFHTQWPIVVILTVFFENPHMDNSYHANG